MTTFGGVNGTACNAMQYQQSLQSYNSPSPSISCLTRGEGYGLVLAAEASFLSCICVSIIFIWICRNVRWYKKKFPNDNWKLFRGPIDIYMFSLFAFDLLQSIGGILNVRWAHDGIVTIGPYCTVQGIIEQIGELGVGLITLFLAIHTFFATVLPEPVVLNVYGVALSLVSVACVFITLWVAIGPGIHKHYETPTPYWCWISPQFSGERLGGEYIWLWIALFASAILYVPLHFWAEGYWYIDEEYRFHRRNAEERAQHTDRRIAQRRTALGMLFYPLAYSIIILPITIARWQLFRHHHVSSAFTFFAFSIFYLSGAINVVLFLIFRPKLLLFPRPGQLYQPDLFELAPQGPQRDPSPAIVPDTTNFQPSPVPSSAALGVEGSKDSATASRVSF